MKNLSKSQYTKGLQCLKALWLYRHRKDLKTAPDAFQESIMESGTEFGELARKRWPGGVLIKADHMHPEDAVAETAKAIEGGALRLYEAAFLFDDVLVRVDVMERVGPALLDLPMPRRTSVRPLMQQRVDCITNGTQQPS